MKLVSDNMGKDIRQEIDSANNEAVQKINSAEPVLIDIKPAIEVIPGMTKNTILHAGPPIEWRNMCGPMRNGVICGVLFENLAETPKEAAEMVESGEVKLTPCHEHMAVGGMTGITAASTSVAVVKNKTYGNEAYCHLHEGYPANAMHFGSIEYDEVISHLRWMNDVLVPILKVGIKDMGGLNVKNIFAQALQTGYGELHGRNTAANSLMIRSIMPYLIKSDLDKEKVSKCFEFLDKSDIFFLHIGMAACRAIIDPAKNIEYSTVVTTFCRNGVEYGIRVSSLGDQWFTGPADKIRGPCLPGYKPEDSCLDIGDSSITETVGFGGILQPTGMRMIETAKHIREMRQIAVGASKFFLLPIMDFEGVPTGFDIRKIVETGIQPIHNTAMAHKIRGGKTGVGVAKAPMECFKKAIVAFSEKYSI